VHQVSVASILFIDNPVGTGYSYVTHDSAFTTDVDQIAQDLMTTVAAFLKQLPDFQVEPFCTHNVHYSYDHDIFTVGNVNMPVPTICRSHVDILARYQNHLIIIKA